MNKNYGKTEKIELFFSILKTGTLQEFQLRRGYTNKGSITCHPPEPPSLSKS